MNLIVDSKSAIDAVLLPLTQLFGGQLNDCRCGCTYAMQFRWHEEYYKLQVATNSSISQLRRTFKLCRKFKGHSVVSVAWCLPFLGCAKCARKFPQNKRRNRP